MAMDAAAVEKEGPPKHPHAVQWGALGDGPGDPQVILGTFTLKSREVPRDHYSVGTRGLGVAECLDRRWEPGLGDPPLRHFHHGGNRELSFIVHCPQGPAQPQPRGRLSSCGTLAANLEAGTRCLLCVCMQGDRDIGAG